MNKKPSLFVNKIDKQLNNNDSVYYSNNEKKESKISSTKKSSNKNLNQTLNQKINSIFKSSNYVYKAEVKIKLKDKEVTKKIVGKNQKYLITMDNELIPISDVLDIEII